MGAFYVLMWVGLVPLALLFGHVWRELSPWRTIQSVLGKSLKRPDGFAHYLTFLIEKGQKTVVAAHDRALALLPRAHRLSGQLAMLVLMVVYTFAGLFLLFSV